MARAPVTARGHGQKSGVASMAACAQNPEVRKNKRRRAPIESGNRRQNGCSGRTRGGATGSTNSKAIVANRMLPFVRDLPARTEGLETDDPAAEHVMPAAGSRQKLERRRIRRIITRFAASQHRVAVLRLGARSRPLPAQINALPAPAHDRIQARAIESAVPFLHVEESYMTIQSRTDKPVDYQ